MKIVFLGSGQFGIDSLNAILDSAQSLKFIITQPPNPAGRGRKPGPTPVARWAKEHFVDTIETDNVNERRIIEKISDIQPDLIIVIAFGQKIGNELINLPPKGTINVHASLLPKYRGAAPINQAIINGDKETGLTIIELNEVWDGGDILGQVSTEIGVGETAGELHDRLAAMGPGILEEVLGKIAGGIDKPMVQDERKVSFAPKLCKGDGLIDWERSATDICNQIHGMWPWPGAYCFVRQHSKQQSERISIARAQILIKKGTGQEENISPGVFLEDMSIVCGNGRLRLVKVKPDNGKLMSFEDFVNGRHLQVGDRLVNGV